MFVTECEMVFVIKVGEIIQIMRISAMLVKFVFSTFNIAKVKHVIQLFYIRIVRFLVLLCAFVRALGIS